MKKSTTYTLLGGAVIGSAVIATMLAQPWNSENHEATHEVISVKSKDNPSVPPQSGSIKETTTRVESPKPAAEEPSAEPTADDTTSKSNQAANSNHPTHPASGSSQNLKTGRISTAPRQDSSGSEKANNHTEDAMSLPPAIRLSTNAKLPAVVMAIADGNLSQRSKPIQAAAQAVVDDFYRDLTEGIAKSDDWQKHLVEDPETGEKTVEVTSGPELETARSRADARFRLLFGDAAYNSYIVQSGVERMIGGDNGGSPEY